MDISQESDPKSQEEIPVRPSFGKNFECYVRERFEENFCGWRISSGHTEREVQLRMFASYRSLELALLFSIYTNKQFKPLKVWIRTARWSLVLLRQSKGKKSQAKLLWPR